MIKKTTEFIGETRDNFAHFIDECIRYKSNFGKILLSFAIAGTYTAGTYLASRIITYSTDPIKQEDKRLVELVTATNYSKDEVEFSRVSDVRAFEEWKFGIVADKKNTKIKLGNNIGSLVTSVYQINTPLHDGTAQTWLMYSDINFSRNDTILVYAKEFEEPKELEEPNNPLNKKEVRLFLPVTYEILNDKINPVTNNDGAPNHQ